MPEGRPTVLMWSGGKDAALALEVLQGEDAYAVQALMTTVIEDIDRVTMHGVPLALIEAQATALGLPLHVMRVPPSPSNATYEERLERALAPLLAQDITTVATGDLFLDDIRAYREDVLRRIGATPHFPIWGRDTAALARHFIASGFRAVVTSVDTTQLGTCFVGRSFDERFLSDLPEGVDPCGEHGAFHSFVTDGPIFRQAIPVQRGEAHGQGRMRYVEIRAKRE